MTGKRSGQTGPKTARGKAASSRNARTHGLLSRDLIVSGESRDEFDAMLAALQAELRPVGLLENTLVERIAVCIWRQRRLVKAESADIELRSSEMFGPAVIEFRNYLGDAARIKDAQRALERNGDTGWVDVLAQDIAAYDTRRPKTLNEFAQVCPAAFEAIKTEADTVRYEVADFLKSRHGNLESYVAYWKGYVKRLADTNETVRLFRESRRLPKDPEILIRYQSGLDNELYKAMRALREAQTYRLASLDVVTE